MEDTADGLTSKPILNFSPATFQLWKATWHNSGQQNGSLGWCSQKSLCFSDQKKGGGRGTLLGKCIFLHPFALSQFLAAWWVDMKAGSAAASLQQWSSKNEEKPRVGGDAAESWKKPESLMAGPSPDFVLCKKIMPICLFLLVVEYHFNYIVSRIKNKPRKHRILNI